MAYKDKEKQRAAQREWVRQKRAKKGSTDVGSTKPTGMTIDDDERVIAESTEDMTSTRQRLRTDLNPMGLTDDERQRIVYEMRIAYKTANELKPGEYNRVSLPGDADYKGVCNGQDNG